MALKKNIEISGNLVFQTSFGEIKKTQTTELIEAIIRVDGVTGTKKYVDATIKFDCLNNIEFTKIYSVPVSVEDKSPNFIKQVYLELKKLPEFANAEDC